MVLKQRRWSRLKRTVMHLQRDLVHACVVLLAVINPRQLERTSVLAQRNSVITGD